MTIIQSKRLLKECPFYFVECVFRDDLPLKVDSEQVDRGGWHPHINTNVAITYDNILRQTVIVDHTEGASKAFNELR